jgi:hypothetical protein
LPELLTKDIVLIALEKDAKKPTRNTFKQIYPVDVSADTIDYARRSVSFEASSNLNARRW